MGSVIITGTDFSFELHLSPGLHLFFDGEVIPEGWTLVSGSGSPFYQRLVRGHSVYGDTGGSDTHIHVCTLVSCGAPTITEYRTSGSKSVASGTHEHGTPSIAYADNIPKSKSLKVIKCDTGTPLTVPEGVIAVFDSTILSGWVRYSSFDNNFIYCDHTVNVSHGTENHLHTLVEVGACDSAVSVLDGTGEFTDYPDHIHTIVGNTDTKSNNPPYLEVLLARSSSAGNIPVGLIGMFDVAPIIGWEVVSDIEGDFYDRFILPASAYGQTGGASTHNHANIIQNTEGTTEHCQAALTANGILVSKVTHKHSIEFSIAWSSSLPPYINVVFAKCNTNQFTVSDSVTSIDTVIVDRIFQVDDSCSSVDEVNVGPEILISDTASVGIDIIGSILTEHSRYSDGDFTEDGERVFEDSAESGTFVIEEVIGVSGEVITVSIHSFASDNLSVQQETASVGISVTDVCLGTETVYQYDKLTLSTDIITASSIAITESQISVDDLIQSSEIAYWALSGNASDVCYGLDSVSKEHIHPACDSGVFFDKISDRFINLVLQDVMSSVEWAEAFVSAETTVKRMLWRFSTAYDKSVSSNLTSLVTVLASELTDLEQADIKGKSSHYINAAFGMSLDYIGILHNLERKVGETDRDYRARIRALPLIAGGTKGSLKIAITAVLGIDEDFINIIDNYKGGDGNYGHVIVEFDTSGGTVEYDEATFWEIVNLTKAAGIKIDTIETIERHVLTFTDKGDGCHRVGITDVGSLNWVC